MIGLCLFFKIYKIDVRYMLIHDFEFLKIYITYVLKKLILVTSRFN